MARKKKEIKTIAELKTYIEGAVEFNPEEWSPSKAQWDMIVEMIMNIDEEPVIQQVVAPAPQTYRGGTGEAPVSVQTGPSMMSNASTGGTAVDNPPVMEDRAPPMDASQNAGARPRVEMTGEMSDKDPNTGVVKSGITVKTPNVDTSEKPYKSGFV